MAAMSTTRGVPFDPRAAIGAREAVKHLRAQQEEQSYNEHRPGQERYRRAQRRGRRSR